MLTISGLFFFVLKTKIHTLIMQSIGSVRQWKTDDFESDNLYFFVVDVEVVVRFATF